MTQAAAHRTRGAERRRGEAEGEAEGGRRRGRGVWAPACLLLVARLVRGLEAVRAEQHEAVDVPVRVRVRVRVRARVRVRVRVRVKVRVS